MLTRAERHRIANLKYARSAKGQAATRLYDQSHKADKRKRRFADLAKYKARMTLGNAIRDGKVQKHLCEICGAKAEAHHSDYSKPLKVRWLCPLHHAALHNGRLS
jgi:hypothetical protein